MAPDKWHNIVVCCDGTWSGAETGTRTNIQILADAFATPEGSNPYTPVLVPDGAYSKTDGWNSERNEDTDTDVIYFNGVGASGMEKEYELEGLGMVNNLLGGSLDMLAYCINGALARDLDEKCKEAYRFIKDKYRGPDESRIWLFGLSRGAYTVRAVAGMINNCGIIKNDWNGFPEETLEYSQEVLLDAVWDIYSSNDEDCAPKGPTSLEFQEPRVPKDDTKVWPAGSTPPIVFMGLLDTVGAVGFPDISGVGAKPVTYNYVPLHDLAVSSEVQHVFQACSTHDRLTLFAPCFVRRRKQYDSECVDLADAVKAVAGPDQNVRDPKTDPKYTVDYVTEEVWYPGAHYDLGRQDFVFGNQPGTNGFNELTNLLRTNVKCLPELADYPLVGYELSAGWKGDAADPNPPCIVGRVCSIDPTLLPLRSNTDQWTALVQGYPLSDASPAPGGLSGAVTHVRGLAGSGLKTVQTAVQGVIDTASYVVHQPKAAGEEFVTGAVRRGADTVQTYSDAAVSTVKSWGQWVRGAAKRTWQQPASVATDLVIGVPAAVVTGTAGAAISGVGKGLHVAITAGEHLPAPIKERLFYPPYTIDAETKILSLPAKYGGVIVRGRYDAGWLLKDRTIPLPGIDDWGFRVDQATFFSVPRDRGSYASYKAQGRQNEEWFMSKSYNKYTADRALGKKNSGEKKWAAMSLIAGRQGQPALSARPAAVVPQQRKQLQIE